MNDTATLTDFAEIDRYEEAVRAVVDGQMDAERFMAFRLQHGIYGQRQDGVHMVRIKLPGGKLNAVQLNATADVVDRYSHNAHAQITTRQDIQVHFVPLANTPALMRDIAQVGLTTREACGNTVRNITACSMAGICPREHTDVAPFVDGAVQRFLRNPLTQHMPRKFKISFSGCESDCAMGMMHDVGVVAIKKDGKFGFKVLAGGGLGHKPHEAVTIEEFIEEKDLLPSIEAALALHNRYSDRKRRAKARIKFLVDKFGEQGFVEKYREEFQRAQTAFIDEPYPRGKWLERSEGEVCGSGSPRRVVAQRQAGLHAFPIRLPTGDITAVQLRGVATIMTNEGLDDIRATADQNLMLINVPTDRIEAIKSALSTIQLGLPQVGDNVVSCPGTTTCRLGITSSKLIAPRLDGGPTDLSIRVSGCHNSCGQHHVGDIGIHGEGKRVHGKLIPHYEMHFGGDGLAGGAIALEGPEIPSARIEMAITRVKTKYLEERQNDSFFTWSRAKGENYFKELLADLAHISVEDMPFVARDFGDTASFQVLQLGGGECAGAAQDRVASNFSEAMHERQYRNAFSLQRKYIQALDCAEQINRLIGNSLLFLSAIKPVESADEAASLLISALSQHPDVGSTLQNMAAALAQLRAEFDLERFNEFCETQDQWTRLAGDICQSIDRQVDLATSLASLSTARAKKPEATIIDLSTYACPLHYIKARNELRKYSEGDTVAFLLDNGESVDQVSTSLASDGHQIIDTQPQGNVTVIKVRKSANSTQR